MTTSTRRSFLRATAGAALALPFAACSLPQRRLWQPNERVRVAIVGLRGRGRELLAGFAALADVEVAALCDVDPTVLHETATKFRKDGRAFATCSDVRTLLDRKDLDAIVIATPNHWHALMGIWACQAGKDVYVEKPVSHSLWEGQQLVAAARKYQRIVQTGTQSRSSFAIADAIAWLRAGHLGKIRAVQGLCYKPRPSIGKVDAEQPLPKGLDYELWCGPAPKVPLRRKSLHYDWHWDFHTGNGDLGNQGVHQMDIARWVLGATQLPTRVCAIGGRFGYDDDGNTPNTLVTWFDYAPAPLVFEVRGLPRDRQAQTKGWQQGMDRHFGTGVGVLVHCEGGTLRIPDYVSALAFDQDGKQLQKWQGAHNHYANFIAAVRSGNPRDLAAEIHEGHLSTALCHLGNTSYRLGATSAEGSSPREAALAMVGSEHAVDGMTRMLDHLQKNEVDLARTPLRIGAMLHIDPSTQRCRDAQGQAMARGNSRAPFCVPERV